MNITFTLNAKSFLEAAAIEECLQNKNIKYTVEGLTAGRKTSSTRKKRAEVTKLKIKQIIQHASQHPTWSQAQLAAAHNVSTATIGRILNNEHALQRRKS